MVARRERVRRVERARAVGFLAKATEFHAEMQQALAAGRWSRRAVSQAAAHAPRPQAANTARCHSAIPITSPANAPRRSPPFSTAMITVPVIKRNHNTSKLNG